MGEIADDIINRMLDSFFDEFDDDDDYQIIRHRKFKQFQPKEEYQWKDASGTIWSMWEMDLEHISNCILHLENRVPWSPKLAEFQTVYKKITQDSVPSIPQKPEPVKRDYPKSNLFGSGHDDLDDEIPF